MGSAPGLLQISLTTPTPLSSALKTDQQLDFDVLLGTRSQMDVESWIAIAPRTSLLSPITGGYLWTPTGGPGAYTLHFIPSAPLTDATDYEVKVVDAIVTTTVLATGFSTGSRPRVSSAVLSAMQSGAQVFVDVTFSEPMSAATIGPAMSVTAGGAPVAGTVTQQGPAVFRFTFTGGAGGATGAVALDIATSALSTTGTALIPDDWDSPTNAGADGGTPSFSITFGNGPLTTDQTSSFTPIVN
jgi:hypothetical protein